jgi:hypothetical protein
MELPARLGKRVDRGGVVLFDLDDTLVVSTEASRASPIFHSHAGYATVVHAAGSALFVAVRPFALAAIAALLAAGLRVGFWSAGTPPYVSAIAERLIDAVRHMQLLKLAKRKARGQPPPAALFVPVVVIALDQANLRWMRDTHLESAAVLAGKAAPPGARYQLLAAARNDRALGTVIKQPGRLAPKHPHLANAGERLLLVDNLRHDPEWTLEVPDFVPGAQPSDRVLMDVARAIMAAAQSDGAKT